MLLFLIRVGRVATTIGAVTTVVGGVVTGWINGMAFDLDRYAFSDPYAVTPTRLGLAVVGGIVGVLVAGSVFGAIAALFEVHRHLRNMDRTVLAAPQAAERTTSPRRSEPKLG